MTEEKKDEKRSRGVKVKALAKLCTSDGTFAKKGELVVMSKEDVKHFGVKVTKDFDDDE